MVCYITLSQVAPANFFYSLAVPILSLIKQHCPGKFCGHQIVYGRCKLNPSSTHADNPTVFLLSLPNPSNHQPLYFDS